ncbi:hypothetical protein PSTG_08704 [Puccinia striiformis f. sp. tritici PST-78]|uniref:SAM-dependent MTase RsmB/NOP-type domain-containing protein n=1 Tax=Puccinia striiformis f. sp. tritici PST-78 TaxID=1165861 RepID=A0A0L0VFK2_9BASI|nr:hypothetical protein PSTG_08704 [Puccinia striiformis f. sp. tritici PST-78]
MITNHDASRFPTLSMNGKKLLFERILCDVPCSGDGTLRKNGGSWRDWTPANGVGLHGLQFRIVSRAITLLKPGGRIVYLTCSLNPLENEAVVSVALSQFPSMSIKDVSGSLPTLMCRPGLTTWTVTTRDPNNIQAVALPSDLPNLPQNKRYPTTLWPSGKESKRGLERCLRIYPHLQNTGGFFVAVLEESAAANNGNTLSTDPLETLPVTKPCLATAEEKSEKGLSTDQGAELTSTKVAVANVVSSKQSTVQAPNAQSTVSIEVEVANGVSTGQTTAETACTKSATVESNKQPAPLCPPTEIVESKQVKQTIPDKAAGILTDQPDSKRAKVKLTSEGTVSTADTSKVKSTGSRTAPQDTQLLDNPFKAEPHIFLKSDNEEIKKCMCVTLFFVIKFFSLLHMRGFYFKAKIKSYNGN